MKQIILIAVALTLTMLAPLQVLAQKEKASICQAFERSVASGPAAQRLKKFLDVQWNYNMNEFPEWATFVGLKGHGKDFTDVSMEAIERRKNEARCHLKAAERISRPALKELDQVTLDLLLRNLRQDVESQQFEGDYLVLSHLSGLHLDLPDLFQSMPAASVKDYEDVLARLEKIPVLVRQHEALLRKGLEKKITPVKMFLQKVPAQFDAILTKNPEDSPLYAPFKAMNSAVSAADQARLQEKAKAAVKDKAYPALEILRNFVVRDYIPGARESIAWSEMPDGVKWYDFMVRIQTTTDRSAEDLHALGLAEVERITAQMRDVIKEVKFKGDIAAFNKMLLKDSKFYFEKPEELMMAYRDLAKRIDAELPKVFGKLPRLPYGVREMPEYKAKSAPTAYYMPGSREGGRAGFFEANTYDLRARPKWGMEALTMHEAVPGHHLQIALAQEIEGLPEFRKHGGYTAFVEGWALYAEGLGAEMGFYKDPYSKYGALSYELWRAVRLVVDTGMHAKGWTRERALTYFMELMPKAQLESEVEIDRYITWPGQALAYKVGQLKFRELREEARRELGEAFDLRAYHDEVLRHGALPMDVFENLTRNWIQAQKAALKK